MNDFYEKTKTLLQSTKPPWKERQAFIQSMTDYVEKTADPKMVNFLNKNYKYIAVQFQDLRYFDLIFRSMIVRKISNFVKACSLAYGEKLNVF